MGASDAVKTVCGKAVGETRLHLGHAFSQPDVPGGVVKRTNQLCAPRPLSAKGLAKVPKACVVNQNVVTSWRGKKTCGRASGEPLAFRAVDNQRSPRVWGSALLNVSLGRNGRAVADDEVVALVSCPLGTPVCSGNRLDFADTESAHVSVNLWALA